MNSQKKQIIWANTIVNDEENFIWFAIMSVIDYVDKILVWDTGSADKTVEIIKEIQKIKPDKIIFKKVGEVDKNAFTRMRQKMLDQSTSDWILILDGDEIWWEESIKSLVNKINKDGDRIDGIVVPMVVPVGDIYHLQEESAGKYQLLNKKGHYSLRAINKKIPKLHVDLPYGQEGYYDSNNLPVQERKKIVFLKAPYLHTTHLKRSSLKDKNIKFKYEIGNHVPPKFEFPEVMYRSFPNNVPSPWIRLSGSERTRAILLTPLRRMKRKILND